MLEAYGEFLEDNNVDTQIEFNQQPNDPDRVVTVTDRPGWTPIRIEGAFDMPHVQVRCRSSRNAGWEARDDAYQIDKIMDDETLWPFELDDRRVLRTGRTGGGPGFMLIDAQGRTEYVCNYWLEIEK